MNTILTQKIFILYCSLSFLTGHFPKKERHGLGLKLENNLLSLLEAVISAEQSTPVLKDKYLNEASIKAEVLKLLLRITMERKLIKESNYFSYSAQLVEIGKMIGGWKKSIRN